MSHDEYKQGMIEVIERFAEIIEQPRIEELTTVAGAILQHFLDKEGYGEGTQTEPDQKPVHWTYTRFFVWDILRPTLGHDQTEYAKYHFSEKLTEDLCNTAHEIVAMLPNNLTIPEWHLLVQLWSIAMIRNPQLIVLGAITPQGRLNLIDNALKMGRSDEAYHQHFRDKVKNFGTGLRKGNET